MSSLVFFDWRNDDRDPQNQWYIVVSAYSWRNLTYRKDALTTLAAFASQKQFSQPDEIYLAGLWMNSLLCDLVWQINRLYKSNKAKMVGLVTPNHLPTWSWASLANPISWPFNDKENPSEDLPCTKVKRILYSTNGRAVLGNVEQSDIELSVPLIRLCDVEVSSGRDVDESKHLTEKLREVIQGVKGDITSEARDNLGFTIRCCNWDQVDEDEDIPPLCQDAVIAPLLRLTPNHHKSVGTGPANALLLLEKHGKGVFERVGTCFLFLTGAITGLDHFQEDFHGEDKRDIVLASHKLFLEKLVSMEPNTVTIV